MVVAGGLVVVVVVACGPMGVRAVVLVVVLVARDDVAAGVRWGPFMRARTATTTTTATKSTTSARTGWIVPGV